MTTHNNIPNQNICFINNSKYRYNLLPIKKKLYPIIKLGKNETYNPERWVGCTSVIIKAQQLLSKDGKSTTKIYNQIQDEGGIHNHLNFGGEVILSSIMPDRTIKGMNAEKYAELINTTGVEYYLTPDGETYLGERQNSESELYRIIRQTKELINFCPNSVPIGLIKGCTIEQIKFHIENLRSYKLEKYCFHLGDFFRGDDSAFQTARKFISYIRENTPELILYGIGSKKHFNLFKSADGFATQSHFVKSYYGYRYESGRWIRAERIPDKELIMHNLRAINQFVENLNYQTDLALFLAETEFTNIKDSIFGEFREKISINS